MKKPTDWAITFAEMNPVETLKTIAAQLQGIRGLIAKDPAEWDQELIARLLPSKRLTNLLAFQLGLDPEECDMERAAAFLLEGQTMQTILQELTIDDLVYRYADKTLPKRPKKHQEFLLRMAGDLQQMGRLEQTQKFIDIRTLHMKKEYEEFTAERFKIGSRYLLYTNLSGSTLQVPLKMIGYTTPVYLWLRTKDKVMFTAYVEGEQFQIWEFIENDDIHAEREHVAKMIHRGRLATS